VLAHLRSQSTVVLLVLEYYVTDSDLACMTVTACVA